MSILSYIPVSALVDRLIKYRSQLAADRQRDVIDELVGKALNDLSVYPDLTDKERSTLAVKITMEALK